MHKTRPAYGRPVALALSVILGSLGAHAESLGDCRGFGALAESPALALGRVAASAPRTRFVLGASDRTGCPDASDTCRDKAFVVPDDPVIVSSTRGHLVCAEFVGPKGAVRAGWLPAASVIVEPPGATALTDWLGTWTRTEAEVKIRPAAAGRLSIDGTATYGALDPGRVRRGAVNLGEINGEAVPDGASLAFTSGPDARQPGYNEDANDCKVWMRRLGPLLLVDDNLNCGGMNVSFRGVYARRPG